MNVHWRKQFKESEIWFKTEYRNIDHKTIRHQVDIKINVGAIWMFRDIFKKKNEI
jgi:hypothetical protein